MVIVAVILLLTGPHLVRSTTPSWRVPGQRRRRSDCNGPVIGTYAELQAGAALVLIVPVLMGMFWGAPLIARELETGNFRWPGPRA